MLKNQYYYGPCVTLMFSYTLVGNSFTVLVFAVKAGILSDIGKWSSVICKLCQSMTGIFYHFRILGVHGMVYTMFITEDGMKLQSQ